jgi:hypothetical protein
LYEFAIFIYVRWLLLWIYNSQGYDRTWYPHDIHYNAIWEFVARFCPLNYRGAWLWYAADEWRKMFDAWVFFIFNIPGIEVFRTTTMGLGKLLFLLCY